ncbi:MAG: biotin synthase BioB [Desulfovibrio sp.]|nr:biotin synthase BioB [Desulfovibrio sp.]
MITRLDLTNLDARAMTREPAKVLASARSLTRTLSAPSIDLCSIINIKSGGCSNDCGFCAQSSLARKGAEKFFSLEADEIIAKIIALDSPSLSHIGLVAAGARLDYESVAGLCEKIERLPDKLKNKLCVSFGTLDTRSLETLKAAGVKRYHHNLETSRERYPEICSTQKWDERAATVRRALVAGMEICSGGLFGLGEDWDDRISLAHSLRDLGVINIPMNFLTPIPGTPLENALPLSSGDIILTVACFRIIHPRASLRICAGRAALTEETLAGLFQAGINAMMTGDFLTTPGSPLARDLDFLRKSGLNRVREN